MWKGIFRISNKATEILLRGLHLILHSIATITSSEDFMQAMKFFPNTNAKAKRFINLVQENFEQYMCVVLNVVPF